MYSTTFNIGQINSFCFFLAAAVLCGCGKADDSAAKKALPLRSMLRMQTVHRRRCDGTVMKAAESDHQPNIDRGEIIGKKITTAR
nr:YbfJ family protein [Bacillus velezensis]